MADLQSTAAVLKTLADPSRVRLLSLLEREALTVAELTRVTRMSQSRVSSHLARMREIGLVRDRRVGNANHYQRVRQGLSPETESLWKLIRDRVRDPLLAQDRQRLQEVLRARGGAWQDPLAARLDRHYLPGRTWEAAVRGLIGLVQVGDVLDVASGDGALAELLAPRARSITCLDLDSEVIQQGSQRPSSGKIRFQIGDMHQLPFASACFDQALLFHALCCTRDPLSVLQEIARVLKPGGRLVGGTLHRHRHREIARRYQHLRFGFEPDELRSLLETAGFLVDFCACTSVERRPPHFEVLHFHASRNQDHDALNQVA
ncbi:MAG: methyltransferase domain-containing protein [Planctomycetota bacterium]|nr:MAG: methyltransferase domain-containing protein [Planctomycetota bacterium]